jgi:hypothetical protein
VLRLSHQIRAEALPLFRDLIVHLPLQDAPDYAKTLDFNDSALMRQLHTKLVVKVPPAFDGKIDVLPLIKAKLRAPHFDIEIALPDPDILSESSMGTMRPFWDMCLNQVFGDNMEDFATAEMENFGGQKKMQDCRTALFFDVISAVRLKAVPRARPSMPRIDILVNASHAQWWMYDRDRHSNRISESKFCRDFCKMLGLRFVGNVRVV